MTERVNIVVILRHPSLFHLHEGWFLYLSIGRSKFLLLAGMYSYTILGMLVSFILNQI